MRWGRRLWRCEGGDARSQDLTPLSLQARRMLQLQKIADNNPRVCQRNDIEMEEMDISARLKVRGYDTEDGPTEDFIRIKNTSTLLYRQRLQSRDQKLSDDLIGSLQKDTVVYRGLGRWHPKWHDARYDRLAIPLGNGPPDFKTNDSGWIPFTTDESIAHFAARSRSGMGKGDNVEFVEGYSKDASWETGLVLKYSAPVGSALCFFNAGEVQVKGPVNATVIFIYTMGTKIKDKTVSDYFPDVPSEEQKNEYVKEHGRLRHSIS